MYKEEEKKIYIYIYMVYNITNCTYKFHLPLSHPYTIPATLLQHPCKKTASSPEQS